MAQVELIMPKMGESIMEATILNWLKKEGDRVEMDETILEIATDKVDSEVPSPVEGVMSKILFAVDDTVAVGTVIAVIETEAGSAAVSADTNIATASVATQVETASVAPTPAAATATASTTISASSSDRFYSPLVRNMAKKEGVAQAELDQVAGSGKGGRVTKKDMLGYLENRQQASSAPQAKISSPTSTPIDQPIIAAKTTSTGEGNVEIIEMDRMRRMIADHMVNSKHTSPHVTSFVEADVTNIFKWREKNKNAFAAKFGEKITFTPIFIEAVVRAINDFPMVNVTVDGRNIIRKKDINIGMAAALPSGNLIVPVIKNADHLSLIGLTKSVNDLANRARNNKLKPDDIQGGTFTVTNVGTFGNVMGTPIINQPQAAILAVGAIRKKPAVVETEYGDLIAIRHMMFLSLSYDHRVVDGFLGGSFLRKIADYMEAFDPNRSI